MRAYKNNKNHNLRYASPLALLALLFFSSARADFDITMVNSEVIDTGVAFTAVVDTKLSPPVEEALAKGISLEVVVDIALDEHRRIWWDPELSTWELRRRVQFHALSDQYVVQGFATTSEGFDSLDGALKHLGTFKDVVMEVPNPLQRDGDYRLKLRARLDIEALPAPLRPVAYTSSAWRLSSGWKKWKVGD